MGGEGIGLQSDGIVRSLLWADNAYLVAGSAQDLRAMTRELALPLVSFGMAWKMSSLLWNTNE